jgi:MraZ protein
MKGHQSSLFGLQGGTTGAGAGGAGAMFRGRFHHTIDPKGRLSIPSRFRDLLRENFGHQLIIVPNDDTSCVQVYPEQEWQILEQRIAARSPFDLDASKLARLFMSRAREISIDQAGRILIPPDFRTQAGLNKDVLIVGGGLKLFEVWDRARFDHYELTHQREVPGLFDKMSDQGG